MNRSCRIEIAGKLPTGLHNELDRRFGPLQARLAAGRTVLEHPTMDQAALRAVLTLLWDAGIWIHVVMSDTLLPATNLRMACRWGASGLRWRRRG